MRTTNETLVCGAAGLVAALAFLLLNACASAPPTELQNARVAYSRASTGTAAQTVPAEVHKAWEALYRAEQSFQEDPGSQRTKDLAYVAERRAELAEALSDQAMAARNKSQAEKQYEKT